jgi:hypothetical protein
MKQYEIKKAGDKWQVWTKDGSKMLGEHDSEAAAKKQLAAVEAAKKAREMASIIGQDPETDEAAIDLFAETTTIKGVELFAAGTWRGRFSPKEGDPYDEGDLDDMVAAYTAGILKPRIKITHGSDDDQPEIGVIENVRRVGGKLLGDLAKVPASLVQFMKDTGAFARRSAEILRNVKAGGRVWPRVLKAVALLEPGKQPAVTSLREGYDFEAARAYEITDPPCVFSWSALEADPNPNMEVTVMDEKTKALLEKHGCSSLDELEAKIGNLEKKGERVDEMEKSAAAIRDDSWNQYLKAAKEEGRILPRFEPEVRALYEAIREDDSRRDYEDDKGEKQSKNAIEIVKAIFDKVPSLVELGEESRGGTGPGARREVDPSKKASDEFDRICLEYVKDGKAKTYEDAVDAVKRDHFELFEKAMTEGAPE